MSTAITSANLELETLLFERDSESDGAVAIVTINRPEAANALNDVMCRDLLKWLPLQAPPAARPLPSPDPPFLRVRLPISVSKPGGLRPPPPFSPLP